MFKDREGPISTDLSEYFQITRSNLLFPKTDPNYPADRFAKILFTLRSSGSQEYHGEQPDSFSESKRIHRADSIQIEEMLKHYLSKNNLVEAPSITLGIEQYVHNASVRPDVKIMPTETDTKTYGTFEQVLTFSLYPDDWDHLKFNFSDLYYHYPIVYIGGQNNLVHVENGVIVDLTDANYVDIVQARVHLGEAKILNPDIQTDVPQDLLNTGNVEFSHNAISRKK